MEMTIDKAIPKIQFVRNALNDDMEIAKAYDLAIETMHKYQKIVGIVSLNDEEFKQCGLKELKEILEVIADGEINSSGCIRP